MTEPLKADQRIIEKAITLISDAFTEHEIPELEGAIAMQAILQTLALKGMDLRAERNLQS